MVNGLLEEPILCGIWDRDVGRTRRAVGRRLPTLGLNAEDSPSEIALDVRQLEPINIVGRSSGRGDISDFRCNHERIWVIRLRCPAKVELRRDPRLGGDEVVEPEEAVGWGVGEFLFEFGDVRG